MLENHMQVKYIYSMFQFLYAAKLLIDNRYSCPLNGPYVLICITLRKYVNKSKKSVLKFCMICECCKTIILTEGAYN